MCIEKKIQHKKIVPKVFDSAVPGEDNDNRDNKPL